MKKNVGNILIIILCIAIYMFVFIFTKNNKEYYIDNSDFLYDIAVDYLIDLNGKSNYEYDIDQ